MVPQNEKPQIVPPADADNFQSFNQPLQGSRQPDGRITVGSDEYTDLSEPAQPLGEAVPDQPSVAAEVATPGLRLRLVNRFFALGQSLVDKNSGKAGFSANFRHNTGKEILAMQDKNYRTKFGMMMGSLMLGSAGVGLFMEEGLVPKVVGGASVAIGMYGSTKSPVDVVHRFNDLDAKGLLAPTADQVTLKK